MSEQVAAVVNYFNPGKNKALRVQTLLCAIRLKESSVPVKVVVSDGSGMEDTELKGGLFDNGIEYTASTVALGFAQGYNQGIAFATAKWTPEYMALCANDVLVDKHTVETLLAGLKENSTFGCAIPYLSLADYWAQNDWNFKKDRFASSMTLNFNLFPAEILTKIGGVPEDFSGYFNDLAMMARLKEMGKAVLLRNGGRVNHLHRTTVSTSSSANLEKDMASFRRLFPDYAIASGRSSVRMEKLAVGIKNRVWLWLWSRAGSAFGQRLFRGLTDLHLMAERAWQRIFHAR